jgi:SulP family sulfate permease
MRLPKAERLLPCLTWMRGYAKATFASDLIAALIVTIMLIPQSLAYALLAGLPAETGLYASMLPLVAYALLGTSRTLSVGPVAVVSLMTAAAISEVASQTALQPVAVAILLALLSGVFLVLLGVLRGGFLANFLSHPVVAGFITASGIVIALSQVKHLLGIAAEGDNLPELLHTLAQSIGTVNLPTALLGGGALAFLFWARGGLQALLLKAGLQAPAVSLIGRTAPVLAVVVTTLLAWRLNLQDQGVALVGAIPSGLPVLQLPAFDTTLLGPLLLPALFISIIGYVESVSVGRTLAAKRREKIDPDQELIGLGAANIASAISGGFPVTGGFSRSVVNYDAGALTPAASLLTAVGIALVTLLFTPFLAWLPTATLAATIVVAVLGLVDFAILRQTWNYSRSDFTAVAATIVVTLLWGVEPGVAVGVGASLALHLYKTSRPHIAEVGEIPGTGHFRNIKRHTVETHPGILSLRVDARLYFINASYIEDELIHTLQDRPGLRHVILMCSGVNEIDISALEVLESINARLKEMAIGFHLSEVKGPVMDRLQKTAFLEHLNGSVFLSQQQAVRTLLEQQQPTATGQADSQDFRI